MNIRLKINAKFLIAIISTTTVILGFTIVFVSIRTENLARENAESLLKVSAKECAMEIEKELSNDLITIKTLAQAFTVYNQMQPEVWKPLFLQMYYEVYKNKPQFYKLWDSWELSFFDPEWDKDHGRFAYTLYRDNGLINHSESLRSLDGDSELYKWNRTSFCDLLWEPYWDEYLEKNETEKKYLTSISTPIKNNNQFAGIVAVDITLDRFQKIIASIKLFDNSSICLVSNNGIIIGNNDTTLLGKNIADMFPHLETSLNLTSHIKYGDEKIFWADDNKGNETLLTLSPIKIGESNTPWALFINVPTKVLLSDAHKTRVVIIIVGIIGLLLLALIIAWVSHLITRSLKKTRNTLERLAVGDTIDTKPLDINTGDEVEEMAQSVNSLLKGLVHTFEFAQEIEKGNLNTKYTPLSDKDQLGNALIEMQQSLLKADEEDKKRKIEDKKNQWANEGIAKFSEILRSDSSDIEKMSYKIISNIIDYLNINQGAIFIINDNDSKDDITFSCTAAIAYGRQKHIEKEIGLGEGLIGRCAFEKKTIYMTQVPDNYIQITSGLGNANPNTLLIVPLILNDEIFGIIELASFNEIEKYQINFVEKLAESIASSISSVKINQRTSLLLQQSKSQAEELAAQEEEMRQNLEELQATQEEAARREYEMMGIVRAINSSIFTTEYDLDGNILSVNNKYANLLGVDAKSLIGKKHIDGYDFSGNTEINYHAFWDELKQGNVKKSINKIVYNNIVFWFDETYIPVATSVDDKPAKIMKLSFDITEHYKKQEILKKQIEQFENKQTKIVDETLKIEKYEQKIKELENEIAKKTTHNPQVDIIEEHTIQIEHKNDNQTKQTEKITTIDTNKPIEWCSNYEFGIDEIDYQHKQLVTLAAALFNALSQGKPKKEVKDNLRSFIDFSAYHFGTEERYFSEFAYDKAQQHINEHKQFTKIVELFNDNFNNNKINDYTEFLAFLNNWLNNHISQFDSLYTDLFKKRGL